MKPLHEGPCAPPNAITGTRKPSGLGLWMTQMPRNGVMKKGLELFGEAARQLGEDGPAHHQGHRSQ